MDTGCSGHHWELEQISHLPDTWGTGRLPYVIFVISQMMGGSFGDFYFVGQLSIIQPH